MKRIEFCDALEAARLKFGIPGISGAVYADGDVSAAATGTTNATTRVEMTTDTVAHIGSITKLFNATLLMQLVDEKIVALDRPVASYLPALRLSDESALTAITVEQLVNHTSGIDANLLPDAGHDGETIENTVNRFAGAGQIHAPGDARSYCNAGTVIAGYLCQYLTGTSWYDLVKQRIFAPLQMEHSVLLPEDALLYRYSVGHRFDEKSKTMRRTPHAFLPIGYAPAGSTAMMSGSDLLTFVRSHLNNGTGPNGKRILSRESAQLMRELSGPVNGFSCFDGGIGWMLLPGGLVHHGGGGPGVLSWVVAHPESSTIVVILTNSDRGFKAVQEVINAFFGNRFALTPFPAPSPVTLGPEVDFSEYAGSYANNTTVHEIGVRDGRLFWNARAKALYADASPLEEGKPIPLESAENGVFFSEGVSLRFTPPANRKAEYLVHSYRLHRRVDEESRARP